MAGSCFFLLSQQKRDAMSFAQRIKTATATKSKERNRESVIAYIIYSFFFSGLSSVKYPKTKYSSHKEDFFFFPVTRGITCGLY